jgi:hypothetical protein
MEAAPIDVSDMPELRQLVEEASSSMTVRPLLVGDRVLALLVPAERPDQVAARSAGRTRRRERNAGLRALIGLAGEVEGGPQDVSTAHDRYLADAYADTHE